MTERLVVLHVTLIEAAHLTALVQQFIELLENSSSDDAPADPAVARLVPDAYRDDPEAAAEFRRLTSADLLGRRRTDAGLVLATLTVDGAELDPAELEESTAANTTIVTLDDGETAAWMRTLTALRLVLASRLGIESEEDTDADDPRFGIYDWLGYRLEGLIDAAERDV
ncbi:DUF2017 family protein [Microbacterium sp. P05]|uniref:DUF2017 family protein n=1 Tax=Microbacterium sp. P05 TaxID=3366948 RepID=UPI00374610E1